MSDVSLRILLSVAGSQTVLSAVKSISGALGGSSGLSGTLATVGLAAGGAAIALGVTAVQAASDFSSSLAKVQAYAGYTQAQTEAMGNSILQMAPQLGEAPKALADALYMVGSAGFKGAAGLQILREAGMTAAASNSDATTITKDLVSSLSSLGLGADQAGNIMDELNSTVQNGLLTWDSYGSVVGKLAGTVSTAGGSAKLMQSNFSALNAALDIYTNGGISARQASMWLSADMSLLDGKTATLTKSAAKLGIQFDANKFQTMNFGQQLQYLNQITDGNRQKLVALLGGNSTVANSIEYLNNHYQQFSNTLGNITSGMKNGQTTQDKFAIAQQTLAFKAQQASAAFQSLLITIGQQLIPIISNIVSAITPAISGFASWIGSGNNLKIVLAAVGAIIVSLIIPALWGMTVALLANPITWVVLGIAALAAAFVHFYQTSAPFRAFINGVFNGLKQAAGFIQANFMPAMQQLGAFFQAKILPILKDIGSFMAATFLPVWQQLVNVWNTAILPALKQVWDALQPLMPVIETIGEVIGGVLVAALLVLAAVFTGVIGGLAKAIAGIAGGLATAFGGIAKIFAGVVQIVSGVVRFIYDLITLNFGALGGDLKSIWSGIVNIFSGAWDVIKGIFQGAWGAISGFVSGLVQGIIGFFTHLWDELVGHSIIPDMINAIIGWFQSLPGKVFTFIENLVSGGISRFKNFWNSIVDDAKAILGTLGSAVMGIFKGMVNFAIINPIDSLIAGVNRITGLLHIPAIPDIPHLASGGMLTVGGLVQVGERGAETVALPAGSAVYPHGSVPAGAAGPMTIINISISTMARSQSEVNRLVDMVEQEIGRRFRNQTSGYAASNVF